MWNVEKMPKPQGSGDIGSGSSEWGHYFAVSFPFYVRGEHISISFLIRSEREMKSWNYKRGSISKMPILSYNLKRICRILASKYKIHTYQGVLLIKKHFICDFKNPANTLNGRTT